MATRKALAAGRPAGLPRGCSRAQLLAAAAEIKSYGMVCRENLALPPLDRSAHSAPAQGGWHYADGGHGAFDTNAPGKYNNTSAETMLIDLVVVPILVKHGVKGIRHLPSRSRGASDHRTWCHADQGTLGDYTMRKYSAAQRAKAVAIVVAISKGKRRTLPTAKLAVDGSLGPATISAWQEWQGTPVDGAIDRPSSLIRSVQRDLNRLHDWRLAEDGLLGPATIKALQRHYGATDWVRALQRTLNTRRG